MYEFKCIDPKMDKVDVYEGFLEKSQCDITFNALVEDITWHDKLKSVITGEMVAIKRKMGYVSDIDGYDYRYATLSFPGQTWHPHLYELKGMINHYTGRNFNSVLLNWYKDGKDIIGWHSDKEEALGDTSKSVIACLNLGATRNFLFRKIGTKEDISYPVSSGDLLIMKAGCQSEYLHAILKESGEIGPRISLTFREVL